MKNFFPMRILVGKDMAVMVGLQVVVSEAFQIMPRVRDCTIIKALRVNNNLDKEAVDWDDCLVSKNRRCWQGLSRQGLCCFVLCHGRYMLLIQC